MSSREIAELTGKQHKQVMRDIRNMLNDLDQGTFLYLGQYESSGRLYDEYNLPKDESICLITGYSVVARIRIIKRWQELEELESKQYDLSLPSNYIEALKKLVEVEEERLALQLELDKAKEWLSIKRVAALNNISWRDLSWHKLKKQSELVGLHPRKIFDANYGAVNTYHMSVFNDVYPKLNLKPFEVKRIA